MRENDHDDLDALIDDTARAMTTATPPVTLRAAVRRRIERPAPVRWHWRAPLTLSGGGGED